MNITLVKHARYLLIAFFLILCGSGPLFAQTTGTVSVRVSDSNDESPIDQVEVKLTSFGHINGSYWGFTDGGGRIEFESVERGAYRVEAKKSGYELGQEQVDVAPGSHYIVQVHIHTSGNLRTSAPAAGTISAREAAIPADARKEFEEGVSSLSKTPRESLLHFLRAGELYPKYPEAWTYAALAYLKLEQKNDAYRAVKKAIEVEPKYAMAYALLGRLYIEDREFLKSKAALEESVRLEPTLWDAHFELSRCYYNLGEIEAALEQAKQALATPNAHPMTHLLLADVYSKLKRNSDAADELETFLAAEPDSPMAGRVKEQLSRLRGKP